MKLQAPKGTFDILPYGTEAPWLLSYLWQYVEKIAREVSLQYGYQEIRTPLYESTELFTKSVGETSDIVTKEMFTFQDKGGRSVSLRPEGTASVLRSAIENHIFDKGSVHKLFYIGPMFRYERPQSGRYRQHHQFGIEALGIAAPEQDVEIIDLLLEFYRRIGLKSLKVYLNTVGDLPSRAAYRAALIQYLTPHFDHLSAESKLRFEKNPLRILDSKDLGDKEIVKDAPSIHNHLTKEAKDHFIAVCKSLESLQIPYEIDPKIVRGLDYYNKTVFEIVSTDLGAQGTVGAGGRYDGLLKTFGGPDLPTVGCATGLERVLQILTAQQQNYPQSPPPLIYFIPLGEEARNQCFQQATACRHAEMAAGIELSTQKIQTALQNALKLGARFAAIIGSEELTNHQIQIKELSTRKTETIPLNQLLSFLKQNKDIT